MLWVPPTTEGVGGSSCPALPWCKAGWGGDMVGLEAGRWAGLEWAGGLLAEGGAEPSKEAPAVALAHGGESRAAATLALMPVAGGRGAGASLAEACGGGAVGRLMLCCTIGGD